MRTATIYNFLIEANIMASIAILLMIVVRRFLRGWLGNRVISFAWLLVAVRLLCPLTLPNPAVNQIRSVYAMDAAIRPIAGQIKVRLSDLAESVQRLVASSTGDGAASHAMNELVDSGFDGSLAYTLMWIYLIGAALVLAWFVVANLRFRHQLKADRIEPISGKLLEQYLSVCAQRGVKPVPVYFTEPLPSACLVGAFRPYIALPLTAKPQEAIQVLTHEISHLKGHDNLWGVLRLLCCVVHWFNPLVWLAANMSGTDGELACDDRVVERLNPQEKMAYANVLVLAAAKRCAPGVAVLATGMTMTGKKLKTRVNAILRSGHVKKGLALSFAILSVMALAGAFATGEYMTWPALPAYANAAPVARRAIANEDEALAYGKELLQNSYMAQEIEDGQWSAWHVADTNGYEVSLDGKEGGLSAGFLPTGEVVFLQNSLYDYNNCLQTLSYYDKAYPDKRDEMYAYLRRFCETVSPDLTVESFRGEQDLDYHNGSMRFVTFYGDVNGDEYGLYFVVQTVPQVRVLYFGNIALREEAVKNNPQVMPEGGWG